MKEYCGGITEGWRHMDAVVIRAHDFIWQVFNEVRYFENDPGGLLKSLLLSFYNYDDFSVSVQQVFYQTNP